MPLGSCASARPVTGILNVLYSVGSRSYWGYIGIMKVTWKLLNQLYRGYIGLCWGYVRIMESKVETILIIGVI